MLVLLLFYVTVEYTYYISAVVLTDVSCNCYGCKNFQNVDFFFVILVNKIITNFFFFFILKKENLKLFICMCLQKVM